MSDTPRTDAFIAAHEYLVPPLETVDQVAVGGVIRKVMIDYAEHARTLERENAALREALRYWMPDETLVEPKHQAAWESHVALLEKP